MNLKRWGPALGAISLAILGSVLYDFLIKPGITSFSSIVIAIVSLGSKSIIDSPYSSAALDPTPLASLFALTILGTAPAGTIAGMFASRRRQAVPPEPVTTRRKPAKSFFFVYVLIVAIMGFGALLILSQSISIWRIFHANLAICAPFISDQQEKVFRARFANMQTREDYLSIEMEMEKIDLHGSGKLIPLLRMGR